MTIRIDMLRTAGRAKSLLGDRKDAIVRFAQTGFGPDGGFSGRGGESDLYYTIFAVEALLALDAAPPRDAVASNLRSFGGGEGLDLVHLACLARCWADLAGHEPSPAARAAMIDGVLRCRLGDGGFGHRPGDGRGSAYYGLLALGALQDLGVELSDRSALARAVFPSGEEPTPLLAGALVLLAELGAPVPEGTAERLLARHDDRGGFRALAELPVTDLLSTATALYALERTGVARLDAIREPCLRFVSSLWSGDGGFHGVAGERLVDSEYTFYGLLSLGCLAG